jgi:hypothetical protein
MSHTVKIATQFKVEHLNAFKRSLEKFGWTIKEKSKARTYHNDPDRDKVYDYVAVNPGTGNVHDVGINVNNVTNELEIMCDFYGGSIEKTLGKELNNLKKEYSCTVIEDKLAYEGYTVQRQLNLDGSIDLIAE